MQDRPVGGRRRQRIKDRHNLVQHGCRDTDVLLDAHEVASIEMERHNISGLQHWQDTQPQVGQADAGVRRELDGERGCEARAEVTQPCGVVHAPGDEEQVVELRLDDRVGDRCLVLQKPQHRPTEAPLAAHGDSLAMPSSLARGGGRLVMTNRGQAGLRAVPAALPHDF